MSDVPSLTQFDPTIIPYQFRVIKDLKRNFDYKKGIHEILLSGSVGSAKSVLMAHIAVTHCLENEKANFLLGRRSMPDLKETILQTVLDHIEEDMVEGEDYEHNETRAEIEFRNGSSIISRSWADRKYKKFRSLKLSGAGLEELTENDEQDKSAYDEIKMRVGRVLNVKKPFIIAATNPDSPAHWAYKYFIDTDNPNRHVYYSVTTDNPFLPDWYKDQLLNDLDPKLARRMVYGEWIEISGEVVYHSYDKAVNFKEQPYLIQPYYPVSINFDFNIAEGKPMSACCHQYINDQFHFFKDFIVEGADTEEMMIEIGESGILNEDCLFLVRGDAAGRHKDTRSKKTDYDIIQKYLSNYRNKYGQPIEYEIQVPRANPPIRTRHNKMNAYMKNAMGKTRFFVYQDAKTLDEGCRLTKLKKGGKYVEDDSKAYQHVTTAAGYGLIEELKRATSKTGVTERSFR